MDDLPGHVAWIFAGCVLAVTCFVIYNIWHASQSKKITLTGSIILFAILLGISSLQWNGFFSDFIARPPRLAMIAIPELLLIIGIFSFRKTRHFLKRMSITSLTHLHLIRIPVEIVLWWLFLAAFIPEKMTFSGSNFDILSGITAPFAAIFLLNKKKSYRLLAFIWNICALALLFHIVIIAIMATPYFSSPEDGILNLAVFEWPFVLLPLWVVPIVLFAHLAAMYQLITVRPDGA